MNILNLALISFALIVAGYILLTLVPFYYFSQTTKYDSCKINTEKDIFSKNHLKHDLKGTLNSFIVLLVLSFIGAALYLYEYHNLLNFQEMSWTYYILSSVVVILFHDMYFFFMHYLMHKSKRMLKYHLYHHKSKSPTPFCVFSFHPVEAFIQFVFMILLMALPIHFTTIIFFYAWMLICNTIGHLNIDLYPKNVYKFTLTKWFNSPTHHYMHHQYFSCNYSIYYNHWDHWFKTNHKNNIKTFLKVKNRQEQKRNLQTES